MGQFGDAVRKERGGKCHEAILGVGERGQPARRVERDPTEELADQPSDSDADHHTAEQVREQLARGGIEELDGVVRFESDLDRGLQRCEDVLLEETELDRFVGTGPGDALSGMPPPLRTYLERVSLPEGTVLIRQAEPPEDVFVLESGRLRVEMQTPEGRRVRLRTVLPGVVVGEVAMYSGVPRTADVVAEEPSVVLRLSRESIDRIGSDDPALAATLHRWLATTLAQRLNDTQKALDALFD